MEIAWVIHSLTGLVTAIFAGYIAIRQLPRVERELNGQNKQNRDDLRQAHKTLADNAADLLKKADELAQVTKEPSPEDVS